MKKLILLRAALIFLCAFPAFESAAQDLYQAHILPKWQPGDEFTFEITHIRERKGEPKKSIQKLNLKLNVLELNETGWKVSVTPSNLKLGIPGGTFFSLDELREMFAGNAAFAKQEFSLLFLTAPYAVQMDSSGTAARVVELDKVIHLLKNDIDKLLNYYLIEKEQMSKKEADELRDYTLRYVLTEEVIGANLLLKFGAITRLYDAEVPQADTISELWEKPFPFLPGRTFTTTRSYFVTEYDPENSSANISCNEAINEEEMKSLMDQWLLELSQIPELTDSPEKTSNLTKDTEDLKFEIDINSVNELDTRDHVLNSSVIKKKTIIKGPGVTKEAYEEVRLKRLG